MSIKEFFDFVTDPTVKETNMNDYLEKVMEKACNRVFTETEKVEDAVFANSYIPYTMEEVVDIERDFRRAKLGETPIYATLHGLKADMSTPRLIPELLDQNGDVNNNKQMVEGSECVKDCVKEEDETETESEDENDDENSYEESGDEENGGDKSNTSIHSRPRDESPNSRRVNIQ